MSTAVIGLGLIGGSLLRALGPSARGSDTDPATVTAARAAGYRVGHDVADAVAGADTVVLAVPLAVLAPRLSELAPVLPPGATVTHVASVQGPALAAARAAGLSRRYVGGHPMAGSEHSGFAAADPDLFRGAAWVLGLEPDTDLDRWLALATVVTGLGARAVPLDADTHDAVVARTSHLPHLLAAALAQVLTDPVAAVLAAGSLRDATRVALSDPALATAMCVQNGPAVSEALAELGARLGGAPGGLIADGFARRSAWPPPVPGVRRWDRTPGLAARLAALGLRGGWVQAVETDAVVVRDPAAA